MFRKTKEVTHQILWVGTLFCLMGILFAMPCLAQKAPEGSVVVAIDSPFQMTGGDSHTAWGPNVLAHGIAQEGLFIQDADGRVIPALAESWEVADDGKSIRFTLNKRAKFHNGAPVTANDVKFSYERAMRPKMKYYRAGDLRMIERIEVIDDYHVTFYFKVPFLGFLEMHPLVIIPKAYVEKVGDAEFAKKPIGAGPFKWVDYQQDVFVKFEAVPDHYRKPPNVKSVHYKFRVDPATIVAMLRAGEADIVKLPMQNIPEVKRDPKLRIELSKSIYAFQLQFCDLAFPKESSPFHDARVRRAVSYAINRKAICEKLMHGSLDPWADIYGPAAIGYDPSLKPDPYNPEKAKALLKEAGYANGFDTTIHSNAKADKLQMQAIAADLARIGIRTKIVELDFATFVKYLREKKFRGLIRNGYPAGIGSIQPSTAILSLASSSSFWTYHTTPEIEAAWKKLGTLVDKDAIRVQAREVSRLWRDAQVRSMLWTHHQAFGVSDRVKYFKPIQGRIWISRLEYLELKD